MQDLAVDMPAISDAVTGLEARADALKAQGVDVQNLDFEVICFDLNNDSLSYQWQINSDVIENYNSQFYNFTSNETGIYELHVTASDSEAQVEYNWIVNVIELPNSISLMNVEDVIRIYPNPMKEYANFEFYLNETSEVLISVFSIQGAKIRDFHLNSLSEGSHSIRWNGRSDGGSQLADGVYICRFVFNNRNGSLIQERKIIFNRNED